MGEQVKLFFKKMKNKKKEKEEKNVLHVSNNNLTPRSATLRGKWVPQDNLW